MSGPIAPQKRLQEEFRLIGRSAVGRQVLERFLPGFWGGRVEIVEFPRDSLPGELRESHQGGLGRPAGGFSFQGGKPLIYLEAGSEIRLRAPMLFHEMVHAVDIEYLASFDESLRLWKIFRGRVEAELARASRLRGIDPSQLTGDQLPRGTWLELVKLRRAAQAYDQIRLYKAERRAWSLLHRWVEEVCRAMPEYRQWLERARAEGHVFDRPVTDEEIRRGYALTLVG